MKNLFVVIMLLLACAAGAQSPVPQPQRLPSPYAPTNYSWNGYLRNDSGLIHAKRDTNWIPRFDATEIFWENGINRDKNWLYWHWDGQKWVTTKFLTNSVENGNQYHLNLIQGTNITLSEDGGGNVTINSTGGGGDSTLAYYDWAPVSDSCFKLFRNDGRIDTICLQGRGDTTLAYYDWGPVNDTCFKLYRNDGRIDTICHPPTLAYYDVDTTGLGDSCFIILRNDGRRDTVCISGGSNGTSGETVTYITNVGNTYTYHNEVGALYPWTIPTSQRFAVSSEDDLATQTRLFEMSTHPFTFQRTGTNTFSSYVMTGDQYAIYHGYSSLGVPSLGSDQIGYYGLNFASSTDAEDSHQIYNTVTDKTAISTIDFFTDDSTYTRYKMAGDSVYLFGSKLNYVSDGDWLYNPRVTSLTGYDVVLSNKISGALTLIDGSLIGGGGGDSVLFQTNTIDNGNQWKLNLIEGTNIDISEDGDGNVTFNVISTDNDWHILGNTGTVDGTNFLGTIDAVNLNFRVNNLRSGYLDMNSTNQITLYGYRALINNTAGSGIVNSAFGFQALVANTTGDSNTVVGASALMANTTGSGSTIMGYNALPLNTGGSNTVFGRTNLIFSTTSTGNSVFGYGNLGSMLTGNSSTVFGTNNLARTTTGNNIAIGTDNGSPAVGTSSSDDVQSSILIGSGIGFAGASDVTTSSVIIGKGTKIRSGGTANVFVGNGIANSNQTYTPGDSNVLVGQTASFSWLVGSGNVAIGAKVVYSGMNGSGNVIIGRNANGNAPYVFMGDNFVSIGNHAHRSNILGDYGITIGSQAAYYTTEGDNDIILGKNALVGELLYQPNLADQALWTYTGWTQVGGLNYKYTHTPGNTNPITFSGYGVTTVKFVTMTVVITGMTTGTLTRYFNSIYTADNLVYSANGTYTITNFQSTGIDPSFYQNLSFVPTSGFDGTVEITLTEKRATSISNNIFIGNNTQAYLSANFNGSTPDDNVIVLGNSGLSRGTNTITIGNSSHTSTKIFGELNIAGYTPANSADTHGLTGDITWDDSYIYIKTTSGGWKRSALSTF